jgi:hypothetical protein
MTIASVGGCGAQGITSTDIVVTMGATVEAGNLIVALISKNNENTTDGDHSEVIDLSDTKGNTWVKAGEYTNGQGSAAAGVTAAVWYTKVTTELVNGVDEVTVNCAGSTDKCVQLWEFTITGNPTVAAVTPQVVDGANGYGSAAISGLASAERLYIRALAKEVNSTSSITPTANFTAMTNTRSRNNTAAVISRGEFRINTSTGETSNPTHAISGDAASVFVAIGEQLSYMAAVETGSDTFAATGTSEQPPVSVTLRGTNSAADDALSVGPFTAATGSLLVAVYGGVQESGTYAPAVDGGGLTWTKQFEQVQNDPQFGWDAWVSIWTAPVPSGGSVTVSATNSGTHDGAGLVVYELAATGGTLGIGGEGGGGWTSGTAARAATLSQAPTVDSVVFAGAAVDNTSTSQNTIIPGTGWTADLDLARHGTETHVTIQRRQGSTSDQADFDSIATQFCSVIAALEITFTADAGGPTGTMAATETGSDTFAASGTLPITGTAAPTETGADDFTADGTIGITGTVVATETGADDFTADGTVGITGTVAASETGADVFAAEGTVADPALLGTLDATETGTDTFAGSGEVDVAGSLDADESGADILAAAGTVSLSGSLDADEAGLDTFAGSGTVGVSGSMAATEAGPDVAAFTGAVAASGALAATEAGEDVFFGSGFTQNPPLLGTMAAVEAGIDVLAATGTTAVSGELEADESGLDTFTASGQVSVVGSFVVGETGADSADFDGQVIVSGSVDADETGSDIHAASGTVAVSGAMAAVEIGEDVFHGSAGVIYFGTMDAVETGSDTFAAVAKAIISAALSPVEVGADSFAASGLVAVSGQVAATEVGVDLFEAQGAIQARGTLAASEVGSDTSTIAGTVAVSGSMDAIEAPDTFAATGLVLVDGILSVTETGDDIFYMEGQVWSGVGGNLAAFETGLDEFAADATVLVLGNLSGEEVGDDLADFDGVGGLVSTFNHHTRISSTAANRTGITARPRRSLEGQEITGTKITVQRGKKSRVVSRPNSDITGLVQ